MTSATWARSAARRPTRWPEGKKFSQLFVYFYNLFVYFFRLLADLPADELSCEGRTTTTTTELEFLADRDGGSSLSSQHFFLFTSASLLILQKRIESVIKSTWNPRYKYRFRLKGGPRPRVE